MRSIALNLHARAWSNSLDVRLGAGELPFDPLLAARACQLLDPAQQHAIAGNLVRAVQRAGRGAAWTASVPVSARAGSDDRDALVQLSARLAAADATDARGVALARRLLTDPDSPLFGSEDPAALWLAARRALLALGETPAGSEDARLSAPSVADTRAPSRR